MQAISDYLQDHNPRELFLSPMLYVAVYRVHKQTIEVWRIWHTSQSRNN